MHTERYPQPIKCIQSNVCSFDLRVGWLFERAGKDQVYAMETSGSWDPFVFDYREVARIILAYNASGSTQEFRQARAPVPAKSEVLSMYIQWLRYFAITFP